MAVATRMCLVAEQVRGHPALRQLRSPRVRGGAPRERRRKVVVLRALLQMCIPRKCVLRGLQAPRACRAAALRGGRALPRRHGCISARQRTHIVNTASMHALLHHTCKNREQRRTARCAGTGGTQSRRQGRRRRPPKRPRAGRRHPRPPPPAGTPAPRAPWQMRQRRSATCLRMAGQTSVFVEKHARAVHQRATGTGTCNAEVNPTREWQVQSAST